MMTDIPSTLDKLKDGGWTQIAIARRLGVSVRSVYRWGDGMVPVNAGLTLKALAALQGRKVPGRAA